MRLGFGVLAVLMVLAAAVFGEKKPLDEDAYDSVRIACSLGAIASNGTNGHFCLLGIIEDQQDSHPSHRESSPVA